MHIEIRLAQIEDAVAMATIHARSWEYAYQDLIPLAAMQTKNSTRLKMYQQLLVTDNTEHYVLLANGTVAGIFAQGPANVESGNSDGKEHEVYGLYVDPDYLHWGLGSQIMEFIKMTAQKHRSQAIVVWVLKDNVQAIAFYHRQGFSLDGCHKVYQCGINLDCLRMTCQLN